MQQQQSMNDGGGGGGDGPQMQMMGAIDSIILEEEIDPDYVPSEDEVFEYAKWLGMDLEKDEDLFWIAREGLMAPLPKDWKPCKTKDTEDIYYFNFTSGESTWDHPCDGYYKKLYEEEKKKKEIRLKEERDGKRSKAKQDVEILVGKKDKKKKKGLDGVSLLDPSTNKVMLPVNGLGPLGLKPLPDIRGTPLAPIGGSINSGNSGNNNNYNDNSNNNSNSSIGHNNNSSSSQLTTSPNKRRHNIMPDSAAYSSSSSTASTSSSSSSSRSRSKLQSMVEDSSPHNLSNRDDDDNYGNRAGFDNEPGHGPPKVHQHSTTSHSKSIINDCNDDEQHRPVFMAQHKIDDDRDNRGNSSNHRSSNQNQSSVHITIEEKLGPAYSSSKSDNVGGGNSSRGRTRDSDGDGGNIVVESGADSKDASPRGGERERDISQSTSAFESDLNKTLKRQIDKLEIEKTQLLNKYDNLNIDKMNQSRVLDKQINAQNAELSSLKDDLRTAEIANRALKEKLSLSVSLSSNESKASEREQALKAEIDCLRSDLKISNSSLKSTSLLLEEAEKDTSTIKAEKNKDIRDLQSKIASLEDKLFSANSLNKMQLETNSNLHDSEKVLLKERKVEEARLLQVIASKDEITKAYECKISSLESDLRELKDRITLSALVESAKGLESEEFSSQFNKLLDSKNNEIKTLADKTSSLVSSLEASNERLLQVERNLKSKSSALDICSLENSSLKSKMVNLEADLVEKTEKSRNLLSQNVDLQDNLDRHGLEIKELRKSLDSTVLSLSAAQSQMKVIEGNNLSKLNEVEEEHRKYVANMTIVSEMNQRSTEIISSLKIANKKLEKDVTELSEKVSSQELLLSDKSRDSSEQFSKLQRELAESRSQLSIYKRHIDSGEVQKSENDGFVESLRELLDNERSIVVLKDKKIQKCQDEFVLLQREFQEFKNAQMSKDLLSDMHSKRISMSSCPQCVTLSEEVGGLQVRITQLSAENDRLASDSRVASIGGESTKKHLAIEIERNERLASNLELTKVDLARVVQERQVLEEFRSQILSESGVVVTKRQEEASASYLSMISSSKDKLVDCENRLAILKSEHSLLNKEKDQIESQLRLAQTDCLQLKTQVQMYELSNGSKQRMVNDLTEKLTMQVKETAALKDKELDMDLTANKHHTECFNLTKQLEMKISECSSLSETKDSLMRENLTLQREINASKHEIATLSSKLQTMADSSKFAVDHSGNNNNVGFVGGGVGYNEGSKFNMYHTGNSNNNNNYNNYNNKSNHSNNNSNTNGNSDHQGGTNSVPLLELGVMLGQQRASVELLEKKLLETHKLFQDFTTAKSSADHYQQHQQQQSSQMVAGRHQQSSNVGLLTGLATGSMKVSGGVNDVAHSSIAVSVQQQQPQPPSYNMYNNNNNYQQHHQQHAIHNKENSNVENRKHNQNQASQRTDSSSNNDLVKTFLLHEKKGIETAKNNLRLQKKYLKKKHDSLRALAEKWKQHNNRNHHNNAMQSSKSAGDSSSIASVNQNILQLNEEIQGLKTLEQFINDKEARVHAMESILKSNSLDELLDCSGTVETLFENSLHLEETVVATSSSASETNRKKTYSNPNLNEVGGSSAVSNKINQGLRTTASTGTGSNSSSSSSSSNGAATMASSSSSTSTIRGAAQSVNEVYDQHSRWLSSLQRELV